MVAGPLWRRLLAFMADLVALGPLLFLAGWSWCSVFEIEFPTGQLPPLDYAVQLFWGKDPLVLAGIVFLLGIGTLYFLIWPLFVGSTPGMWLLGLTLVDEDGRQLSAGASTVRALAAMLSASYLWLGFLWILFDPKRQGFHDKVAGTQVVRRSDC